VVKATVSMDWDQVDITTSSVDPATSVIRSSQALTEAYSGNGLEIGGVPGALTNLPPLSTTTSLSDTQAAEYWRQENTTNYEFTQVESHQMVAPGQVDRISLSVLVDGITDTQQLDSLTTAIAAAGGINTTRGDVLAVESLTFDRTYYDQQAAAMEQDANLEMYIQIGVVVLAVLLLIALLWYVQRLLNNLRMISAEAWQPVLMPAAALASGGAAAPGLPPATASLAGLPAGTTPATGSSTGPAAGASTPPSTPARPAPPPEPVIPQPSAADEQVERILVRLAEENPTTVADVIRMWLGEDEKRHG
ncbi:MAG: hypothetical protein JNK29_05015, partial [Anaerolineales bacterium]|nr:hypothetical protein [Anaerolineales bacterium]